MGNVSALQTGKGPHQTAAARPQLESVEKEELVSITALLETVYVRLAGQAKPATAIKIAQKAVQTMECVTVMPRVPAIMIGQARPTARAEPPLVFASTEWIIHTDIAAKLDCVTAARVGVDLCKINLLKSNELIY